MPTADVNGIRLYYEESGRGRPLVLLHGFACGVRMWDAQVAAFAPRHRVLAYDARGHGASDVPAGAEAYSPAIAVGDLDALLAERGIDRTAVIGLSMGGTIALGFAFAHPEKVGALVVCDTGAGSDGAAEWALAGQERAALLERGGIEVFADAMMQTPLFGRYASQGPEAARHVRSLLTTHRARGLAHVIRRVLAPRPAIYSLATELRGIRVPTLLVVGELDDACLRPHRFMAETIPGVQHVVIEGVGHLTNLEAPATFNGLVGEFLARAWRA